jgi:hypothetical protein
MQKLILAGLLFSFLLSACDDGRNIDMDERYRRLSGGEPNSSSGAIDKDIIVLGLDVGNAQFQDADKKVTFYLNFSFCNKSEYVRHSSLLLVDLQTQLLYLYESTGMKVIGSVECTSTSAFPCRAFKMREALSTYFPFLNTPALNDRPLEIDALTSSGLFELQKKVNDVWTPMGTMTSLVFNMDSGQISRRGAQSIIFHSFPGATPADTPTWFYHQRKSINRAFPFYDPVPGYQLMEIADDKSDSEVSFLATYLNVATGQILTQQYRVENVQK